MNSQIRLSYDKSKFNKIAEMANKLIDCNDEKIKMDSSKFINKIMKFSYVKDGNVFMNLYPSETKFLITLLMNNVGDVLVEKDWYEELLKQKEEYKKNKDGDKNA